MSTVGPSPKNNDAWRERQIAFYKENYLPEEKKWIRLGADGALYYDVKSLLALAIAPLYVLSNEDASFDLHPPHYGFSEGSPQTFTVIYERYHLETTQIVRVFTRDLHIFDDHELKELVGPPLSEFLISQLISSFAGAIRSCTTVPEPYWSIIQEFSKAQTTRTTSHTASWLASVQETTIGRIALTHLNKMERHRGSGLDWSFFHVDKPFSASLAFSALTASGSVPHMITVSTFGLSRLETLTILDKIRLLGGDDDDLIRRTESGWNKAERRVGENNIP